MEIRHLECFLEIVRLGSFSKAAKVLHISQPAASKMIHAMEQELGLPVLYRQNRNLTLTDIGQAVFERAQPIVALFHGLHAELEDVAQARKGRLRIGLPPIASSSATFSLTDHSTCTSPGLWRTMVSMISVEGVPG